MSQASADDDGKYFIEYYQYVFPAPRRRGLRGREASAWLGTVPRAGPPSRRTPGRFNYVQTFRRVRQRSASSRVANALTTFSGSPLLAASQWARRSTTSTTPSSRCAQPPTNLESVSEVGPRTCSCARLRPSIPPRGPGIHVTAVVAPARARCVRNAFVVRRWDGVIRGRPASSDARAGFGRLREPMATIARAHRATGSCRSHSAATSQVKFLRVLASPLR